MAGIRVGDQSAEPSGHDREMSRERDLPEVAARWSAVEGRQRRPAASFRGASRCQHGQRDEDSAGHAERDERPDVLAQSFPRLMSR
jgi:hypothetical protein